MNRSNSKVGSGMSLEYKNGYKVGATQINYRTSSNSSDNEIQGIRGYAIKNDFINDSFKYMP